MTHKETWRKSSFSEPNNNNCVEVAYSTSAVGVRDSKNPDGGRLTLTPDQWARVVASLGSTSPQFQDR